MAQLHIGHSFITHSFLLKGEELPRCIGCDQHLTIEHILRTCSDFIEVREIHFTAQYVVLGYFAWKDFNYFKEINIFGKIYIWDNF